MTLIGVKLRQRRNLYVLVIHVPGSRKRILERRIARRPWVPLVVGDVLELGRKRARVTALATRIDRRDDDLEHVTSVYSRLLVTRRVRRVSPAANVIPMPAADESMVAQFLRYHVLVRVFDGDPDAWLAHLRARGSESGDVRFARWIRSRLRRDPNLLASIRKMVDATPFWEAVAGCQ